MTLRSESKAGVIARWPGFILGINMVDFTDRALPGFFVAFFLGLYHRRLAGLFT